MFKIECGNCGRMAIEVSGSVVICAGGHGVAVEALHEFNMPTGGVMGNELVP